MKLYLTARGPVLQANGGYHPLVDPWDALVNRVELADYLRAVAAASPGEPRLDEPLLAPIGAQEVWAAGVAYLRSRAARMAESQHAGGGDFYDRVYGAARPELFFKAAGWRVRGHGEPVQIRDDANWSVPEPELALYVNARGEIVGYTIGNDMSARDLEGENPLNLPQAKIYDGSCALGPAVLVRDTPLPPDTSIELTVIRSGEVVCAGSTNLSQMHRSPAELVDWLYRATSFPQGCVLLTGTGIVPPDDFTLRSGDEVRIAIQPVGTLVNPVQ
ncbi:MAG: fumarylacetoacetate hydrolase family protein [Gemmatimonadota bacterium]|nr:MAG: fumarylacetoacetate hydrolase family protein [Gemmatimonadota bacterium]